MYPALLKYMVNISSFVYDLSSLMAMTHSFSFWMMRSTLLCVGSWNSILANCWVMVLPPPELALPPITVLKMTRPRLLMSMPECS